MAFSVTFIFFLNKFCLNKYIYCYININKKNLKINMPFPTISPQLFTAGVYHWTLIHNSSCAKRSAVVVMASSFRLWGVYVLLTLSSPFPADQFPRTVCGWPLPTGQWIMRSAWNVCDVSFSSRQMQLTTMGKFCAFGVFLFSGNWATLLCY